MKRKITFDDQLRRAIAQSELTRYRISKDTGIAQSILSRFMFQGAGLSMDSVNKLVDCLDLELTPREKPKGGR